MGTGPARRARAGFWDLASPVRGSIWLAGVLSGLGAIAGLVPVLAVMGLVGEVLPTADGVAVDGGRVWSLVLLLVGGVVAAHVLARSAYAVSHAADARLGHQLRQRQLDTLLGLPLDWFGRTGSGRVKKIVQDDVAKVHHLVAHVVPDTVDGIVRPLASLTLLFVIDWRLGLLGLVPLVLAFASFPLFMRFLADRFDSYNAALADLGAATAEFVRGIEPIKVFEADGRGHRRFAASARAHHRFYSEWMRATIHGSSLLMVFTSPSFAVAVAAVGSSLLVVFAGLGPVVVVAAVLLAAGIAGPLFLLIQLQVFLREADGAARDLGSFFALPVAVAHAGREEPTDGDLVVDDVSFAYDDGPRALDRVGLSLRAGSMTALVGPSGSGKSTLASLVPRLLDPDDGRVLLGGTDLRELPAGRLYREVGFVLQHPFVLRMSVRDNIALARPDATDADVVRAASVAQIHERILDLPHGYDTIVGEGVQLSGGERQRLSIARAVLQDAPILVLDEATAFADPDSETAIQRALGALTRGRTLLVVAHRLHTVTAADQIVVLEAGRVAERGTHAQLVAAGGGYARAWAAYESGRSLAPRAPVGQGGPR